MPIQTDSSGARFVHVAVTVQASVESAFRAVATSEGISAWFVPTTVEGRIGGKVACDFGGGMVSSAEITQWEPPLRFVAEDSTWIPGGVKVATEWSVRDLGRGQARIQVEHRIHAADDQFDEHLKSTEDGWPGYFRVLDHYLKHHEGEIARSLVAMVPSNSGAAEAWPRLMTAMGAVALEEGQSLRFGPDGVTPFEGRVLKIDHLPQGMGAMLQIMEPAAGLAMIYAMDCMGMQMASFQLYAYGEKADAAVAAKDAWVAWLQGIFPGGASEAGVQGGKWG